MLKGRCLNAAEGWSLSVAEGALDFARAPIVRREIHTSTSLGDRQRRPSEVEARP